MQKPSFTWLFPRITSITARQRHRHPHLLQVLRHLVHRLRVRNHLLHLQVCPLWHTSSAVSPCEKAQWHLPDRAGILVVSVRAYLGVFQLVLNQRHRLQEVGRANRLCALVAVEDGTEVAKLDRTLGLMFIARTRPKPCAKYYRAGPLGYYPDDSDRLRHVSPKQQT